MTARTQIERQVADLQHLALAGLGLFIVPIVAACVVPWLGLAAPLGAAICLVAVKRSLSQPTCVRCRLKIADLRLGRNGMRLLGLPADLTTCPHCGLELDAQLNNEGLTEILSAYEQEGEYRGLVGIPVDGQVRRFELSLKTEARDSFRRILRLHPFDSSVSSGYRYFFVPPVHSPGREAPKDALTVRIEKGDRADYAYVPAPQPLVSLLEWASGLQCADQIPAFREKLPPS